MEYQQRHDGPLKQETIDYLRNQRNNNQWSYATLGKMLGISGAFLHNLMNKNANISTATVMQKVAAGIDRLKSGETQLPALQANSPWPELLEHTYNLRNDLAVSISLPVNLTEREAERLSLFIRSLAQ